ncbi:hypothetical protein M8J76_008258 [Diaphorina citri]|nr:hypothetical protein M8J76_008258 [Diaphorina citri]
MNETDKVNTEWWSFADHLIKTDVTESLVKISLTNSKHLWTTILLKDDLVKMAKEQNPAMEASDVRFLSAGLELLRGEPNDLQCNVQYEDVTSSVTCLLRSSLEGFSFSLNVNLVQANLQQYYEQITLPLLLTIQQLQTQREELLKIINTKDEEIGEYRLTGATLFRKSVATKFFNKEEFLQGSCGKTKIPSSSLFQPDTVFRDTLSLFNQIKAKYDNTSSSSMGDSCSTGGVLGSSSFHVPTFSLPNTFLCCFPLQAGSLIMSTFMFTLGMLGILCFPFLPYSGESYFKFCIIFSYTVLLVIASILSLIGSLNKELMYLIPGFLLSVITFIFWLYLMYNSGLRYTQQGEYCFGLRCPESHWLLPREVFLINGTPSDITKSDWATVIPLFLKPAQGNNGPLFFPSRNEAEAPGIRPIERKLNSLVNEYKTSGGSIDKIKNALDSLLENQKLNRGGSIDKIKNALDSLLENQKLNRGDSIDKIENALDSLLENQKLNRGGSIDKIENALDSLLENQKLNRGGSIVKIENGMDSLLENQKLNRGGSVNKIENALDSLLENQKLNRGGSMNKIENALDSLLENQKLNRGGSMNKIENALDSLLENQKLNRGGSMNKIENALDSLLENQKLSPLGSYLNFISETQDIGGVFTPTPMGELNEPDLESSKLLLEKLIANLNQSLGTTSQQSERPEEGEGEANVDQTGRQIRQSEANLNQTVESDSKEQEHLFGGLEKLFRVENFQLLYQHTCFRRRNKTLSIVRPYSYMNSAFPTKTILFLKALAVIYILLFLYTLLTLLLHLMQLIRFGCSGAEASCCLSEKLCESECDSYCTGNMMHNSAQMEPEDKKKEIKVKTEPGTPPSQSSTSQQPTKQKSRSESPVLLLSKRPQRGKLASLI